jgi:hypothetical protein
VVHLLSQKAAPEESGDSRAAISQRLAARPSQALEVLGFPRLQ